MKRIVALVLFLVMAFSLCSCGGSTEGDTNGGDVNSGVVNNEKSIEEVLTSGEWKEQGGEEKIYEFNVTGSGIARIDVDGGITFKWSVLEDRYVRIEATHVLGIDMTYDYEFVEQDGTYYLDALNSNEYDFVLMQ